MSYVGEYNNIDGFMNPHELEWLYEQATKMYNVAEIGCWKGKSSHALLSGCQGKVYCIDHFKGSSTEIGGAHKEAQDRDISVDFTNNVGKFTNLVLIKMDSAEAAQQVPDVDMVFIDGGHDYVTISADLKAWKHKARKLICGHDATQDGVPQALKEHFPRGYERVTPGFWLVRL
jgi:precorrin-6B methylase 2